MTESVSLGAVVDAHVPATSANLGPGFDALGLALSLYDEVRVRATGSGLRVDVIGEGAETVGRDEGNLVVTAIRTTFDLLGVAQPGLEVSCTNRIPHGRGLGSSSAAIVAGILTARALVEGGPDRLTETGVLELADEIEGHPDNVAAALLGGLTVAWKDESGARASARAVRLEPTKNCVPVVFIPGVALSTSMARGLLPATVSHGDAARNAGRSALLVAALTGAVSAATGEIGELDAGLLLAATEDRLHQEQRAPSMPPSWALVRQLRMKGIPGVVSGAGPSVLALAPRAAADEVAEMAVDGFATRRMEIDRSGAVVKKVA